MLLKYNRRELHHEIAEIAYVIADVASAPGNSHRLHHTFDICQESNLPRIDNLINLAFAEAASILSPVATGRGKLSLWLNPATVTPSRFRKIKETLHEFLISRALAGWLPVTLPEAAPVWKSRAEELLSTLSGISLSTWTGRRTPSPL